MADLLTLVQKQSTLKSKLSRIHKELQQHKFVPLTPFGLRQFLDDVRKIESKLDDVQDGIMSKVEDEGRQLQQEAIDSVDDLKFKCQSLISEYLSNVTPPTASVVSPSDSGLINPSASNSRVKLPKLELPTFGGRYEDWPQFKDQFEATIIKNRSLSSCEKLQYLKSLLKDEASRLIDPFVITNSNFNEAWELCTARYGNMREICFSLIRKLLGLPKVTSENSNQLRVLVDSFDQCCRQLRNLQCNVDQWDNVFVVILLEKVDEETRKEYAKQLRGTSIPSYIDVKTFLDNHIRCLSSFIAKKPKSKDKDSKNTHTVSTIPACIMYSESHYLSQCEKFKVLNPKERGDLIKSKQRCLNCFGVKHSAKDCKAKGRCKVCQRTHHTLLHLGSQVSTGNQGVNQGSSTSSATQPIPVQTVNSNHTTGVGVLLGTACVKVCDSMGEFQSCRVLLDPGSEASFVTDRCVKRLGLIRSRCNVTINGVGATSVGKSRGQVSMLVHSNVNNFSISIRALILSRVSGELPSFSVGTHWKNWTHINDLVLADSEFYQPRDIDILLGADVTQRIFTSQRIMGRADQPIATSSEFGWLIMGPVNSSTVESHTVQIHTATLEESVSRFWELDSVPDHPQFTEEEKQTEAHFVANHSRNQDGRYCVPLPFNSNIRDLGCSRQIALRRLHQVEKRLSNRPDRKVEYNKFMSEYLSLGHMEEIPKEEQGDHINEDGSILSCYLPHHFVLKEDSATTKLRVVFDGSCPTNSTISLNKCLMVGPTIQADVFCHLLKFRMNPIAIKADIKQMYRQFLVSESDANYQRILWRENSEQAVKEYRLRTVTYGTSSAPFSAVRALQQLAKDEGAQFPTASRAMLKDFYVDDLLSGGSTSGEVINLYRELVDLAGLGKLELRQWASNSQEVLEQIPRDVIAKSTISLSDHLTTKALGVQWVPEPDILQFSSFEFTKSEILTKRVILRDLSRLFDPLGLLSPFVISIKIFFQNLWSLKLGWDDEISADLQKQWKGFCNQFECLDSLQIPRAVVPHRFDQIEIHGFSDASEKAYSAVIYVRTLFQDQILVRILVSKTKVSPVKAQSLPRLELCGALLLAKLINSVVTSLDLDYPVYCWTDSEIVLKWIASPSRRWATFVANRVSEIQQLIPTESWKFVPGEINSADCASRGIPLTELAKHPLWWAGPPFLMESSLPCFQLPKNSTTDISEERKVKALTVQVDSSLLNRFSCYKKLRRVTVMIITFILKLRKKPIPDKVQLLDQAEKKLIRLSQLEDFGSEIEKLEKIGRLNPTSKLKSLHPFLDSDKLLRLSGRLTESNLPDSSKHQIILCGKSNLAHLIVSYYHFKYHHAGNRLLLSLLQGKFWIIRGRDRVKAVTSRCLRCRLLKQKTADQLMGSLPKSRINPSPPFAHSGVDYAGPFTLQIIEGRGRKHFKAYFCVFVCMATKACHLEPVTDLSSKSFIATLSRFTSRRGLPIHLYSDCGTNFKGANTELMEFVSSQSFNSAISEYLADSGVSWHFNPPSAPHHGGLWESAVRSTKFHLQRVVGGSTLTLSEFNTILTQVEAALNSRPLMPLTSDPDEFAVLTPGHFLIGRPLLAVPQKDVQELSVNRLDRWQRQQQMFQSFWKSWSTEYLSTLQTRAKWTKENPNLKIGDLVAIKEDNIPPLRWKLGRIVSTHPGKDGLVRVITLRTATGQLTRPITKVVPLLAVDKLNSSS